MARSVWVRRVGITVGVAGGVLAIWQAVSAAGPYSAVVPSPAQLARQMKADANLYWLNIVATVKTAAQGYLWGNLAAVLAALAASRYTVLQRWLERVAVTAIALPLIAVAPILSIVLSGDGPGVVLAAQSVVFTTVVSALLGLRSVDARSVDVIRAAGGSEWTVLRRARLPAALPQLVGGLQIAAPSAILGAIIGEYIGAKEGLGVAMIQAQGSFMVARLWGLLVVTSLLAAVAYIAVPLVFRLLVPAFRSVETVLAPQERRSVVRAGVVRRLGGGLLSLVLTVAIIIGAWWALASSLPNASSLVRGPSKVIPYLIHGRTALDTSDASGPGRAITYMLGQLVRTLIDSGLGLVVGTAIAVVVSIAAFELKALERVVLAVSIALRSIPILAVVPLLALVFGRGLAAITVLIAVMTFFPTVVNMLLAMREIPAIADDILRSAGASRWQRVRRLRLPYALPGLLASVKIALPASIGAAMIAEWLATGSGLGAALTVAAANYDYNFIWGAVFIILLTSLAAYHLAGGVEEKVLERRA